ncbi:hypothetical protein CGLO_10082 [Colletotrichum gloeosporioides Cg-14]|uniref:Zn(2)-C6 fungal-type domain-containing protein n=1 Tax=Colletotrichum gloeosporioides (strain Cg-14) TaxID=1237896 RepID=T0KEF7_COLGC|nr:hypothetical protein CGLO_10082 [Colletotrichum gloeosporioides Cg-14]
MTKPLRQIRPRPRTPEDAAAGPLNANRVARRSARPRKTPSACDPCRKRKIKCDGALPRCLMCVTRREVCTYTYSIRHTVTVAEGEEVPQQGSANDVLESLKTMPYDEALELLRKLRQGTGNTPSPIAPPSEVQLLRGMLPPTPNILESELSMRHHVAYPALSPISFTPALGNLLRPLAVRQSGRQEISPARQYPLIRDSESSVSGEEMFTPDSAPTEFGDDIYFHAIVTDLFRPFLTPPTCNLRLNLFSSQHATPKAVYAASVNQLKRLCLLFRLRYKKARFSGLWQTAVIYVANAMMQEAAQSKPQHQRPGREWRFYLDLCLAGLTDLCVSFSTSGAISRAVVVMALQNGTLKPAEANRVLIELKRLEMAHEEARLKLNGNTEATWVVDLNLALTDIEAARGQSLVQRFEKMMLSSEVPYDDTGLTMDLTTEVSS